ncbi:Ribosomal biogenesis protein LAS1L [Camellia lanceoleosa]|uniref:Ribosomal biogenesis protein LAS1L n=1 Tax=Camellia lanceoleosa TaxID=1840588 RepID=A0ACC0F0W6_9ERIC|nr:Ribosomal biogenesis protein LAS1L [Camellia lanceoleosa]
MESLLGFMETMSSFDVDVDRSCNYKLVPWLTWDEWDFVRGSLLSSSPHSIASALQRITVWRSRGCLPVVIEVTASIVEIQQKDPFFRVDLGDDALDSEELLTMLYCMAIVRLVNGVVEKTRKKIEVSIAEAADAINIPRMLIDIRHEGSHRDLPSLRLVRLASIKALDWLKSYYWEPQKKAIPFQSDGIGSLRKEIKYRLCELAFWLKIKHTKGSSSSLAKGKRSKKQITKAFKHFIRLYSSYSLEVVSVLVQLLLSGSDSKSYQVSHSTTHVQSLFDDWKPVVKKLSNKEPELLLNLIKAVLEKIETQEAMEYESGEHAISENTTGVHHIERLSDLFEWLVRNLKGLKPIGRGHSATVTEGSSIDTSLPKATLVKLLRKSLLVSSPSNNQLRDAALVLAQMIGNSSLVQKLNKLCFLDASNPTFDEENSPTTSSESNLARLEDSIHQAAKKLEFVKLRRVKSNVLKTTDGDVGNNNRWVITKSWNSCPIGMLPCDVGSSGQLPVLDCDDDDKYLKPLESKEQRALNEGMLKRGLDCDVELFNDLRVKKMRGREGVCELDGKDDTSSEGVKGRLMIGGVWKKVEEEEVFAIASAVRILV